MGLMRALQGVATGYLDARVGQFEAAAEAKRKEKEMLDKYKAEEAMRIAVDANKHELDQKALAEKEIADRERRKNDLLNLGFTDEFIAAHGQYALGSDNNFSSFIKLGQDTYGIARWWDTPINFGSSQGMNVQEYLMSSGGTFDNNTVKKETKDRVNIPDAIADNQIQTDEKPLTTKKEIKPLFGKDLFFAKPTRAQSEGKNYINHQNGQIINAFQYEQDIGEKNFGGAYYTTVYEEHDDGQGGKILMPELHSVDMRQFVSLEGNMDVFKKFNKDIKSSTATSYLVWNPKTEREERITGRIYTYHDETTEEILDGISPSLAQTFNIELTEKIKENLPPTLGFEKETTQINTFSVNKNDFEALSKLELRPVSTTSSGDDLSIAKYKAPDDMSTTEKNQYKQNAVGLAGFDIGKSTEFKESFTDPGSAVLNFIGVSEADKAAKEFGAIIDTTWNYHTRLLSDYQDSRGARGLINETIAKELGLESNNPQDIQPEVFANSVAAYYKEIRTSLGEIELSQLERLQAMPDGDTKVKEYFLSKGFTEKEYESTDLSLGALSSDIVDRQLQTKNNLNDLIQLGLDMQGEKEIFETQQKSQAERAEREAVIKYFPPSEFDEAGVDMFESFIDNYVNDPDSQEQIDDLRAAIDNLSSDNAERQSLKKQAFKYLSSDEYKEKYPYSDEDTDFQTREKTRKVSEDLETELTTKEMDINSLLTTRKDGSTDYTEAIKSLDYTIPKSGIKTGVSGTQNKLQPIMDLIGELNKTERLPEPKGTVVRAGGKKKSIEEIKAERAEKIIELKKQIETQMVALKQKTSKAKKVKVLDTPAFNPADEIQQEENIKKLKNKTMSVSAFNKLYGVGAAESILKK